MASKNRDQLTKEIDAHVKKLSELVEASENLPKGEKAKFQAELAELQLTLEELRAKRAQSS